VHHNLLNWKQDFCISNILKLIANKLGNTRLNKRKMGVKKIGKWAKKKHDPNLSTIFPSFDNAILYNEGDLHKKTI